jgi:hypothetical protein
VTSVPGKEDNINCGLHKHCTQLGNKNLQKIR